MPDVFISYSRTDAGFVRKLADGLELAGKEVWVDLEDIPAGSRWRDDIERAIQAANGVVLVLSPDFLRSRECQEEARIAARQGKRIVPVVLRPADPDSAPPEIAELNWRIAFLDDARFDDELAKLVEALDTDLEWVRNHTRYQVEASKWVESARDRSFLLRGSELVGAEAWIARQAGKEPPPTELQSELLLASRRAASRRQRGLVSTLVIALAAALALTSFAFAQRSRAISREKTARARELATSATSKLQDDPALAVTLATIAVRTHADPVVLDALREALLSSGARATRRADGHWMGSVPRRVKQSIVLEGPTRPHRGHVTVTRDGLRRRLPLTQAALVNYSPHGRRVAACFLRRNSRYRLGTCGVWDPQTGHEFIKLPAAWPSAVAFAPDGDRFAIGSTDRTVEILRVRDGATVVVLPAAETQSTTLSLAFSPDGELMATGGDDGIVRIWNAADGRLLRVLRGHLGKYEHFGKAQVKKDVESVAFSADGRLLASEGSDNTERIWATWPVPRLARLPTSNHHMGGRPVSLAAFSADGRQVVAGGPHANLARIREIWKKPKPILDAAFSPDGRRLVVSSVNEISSAFRRPHDLELLDTTTGKVEATLKSMFPDSAAIDFVGVDYSSDGQMIAAAGVGAIYLWRPDQGKATMILTDRLSGLWDVAISPDDKWLASTGRTNGFMRLWALDRIANQRGVLRSVHPVTAVSVGTVGPTVDFSADSRFIALSGGTTTTIWEIATRRPLLKLPGNHPLFAPTGHRVATSVGREVWLWDCEVCGSADDLLRLADSRQVRPLTATERRTFEG